MSDESRKLAWDAETAAIQARELRARKECIDMGPNYPELEPCSMCEALADEGFCNDCIATRIKH